MTWHPDVPDLPISKPKIIQDLEQMDRNVLEAMPPAEINKMVESVAYNVAKAYVAKFPQGNLEECIEFASIALSVTGSALGGKLGQAMVAGSEHTARIISQLVFSENEETL